MRRNEAWKKWLRATTATAMMACSVCALASDNSTPDDPSQKQATPAYRSAFADYRSAVEEKEEPSQVWRLANDEMARLKGHAGHIRDEPLAVSPDAHSSHHPTASKDKK